jgi:hypothetical protein
VIAHDGAATLYTGANDEYSAWTRTDNHSSFLVPVQETFLDPAFWHALGRALGWEEVCELAITCGHGHEECRRCHGSYWMYQWHCFIQHLADGQPPDTCFARLRNARSPKSRGRVRALTRGGVAARAIHSPRRAASPHAPW